MRAFSCPAQYKAFVEAELSRIITTVQCDRDLRTDESDRIRALAMVPDAEVNPALAGTCTIIVNVSGDPDSFKRIRDVLATGAVTVTW